MPLSPGTLLNNRYSIERTLGQGGFGAVYLAVDQRFGLPCAVKENLNASAEAERQFRREAGLLATLRHPHLPRVTDHFVLAGHQYLVMDFVEGDDLKQLVDSAGALPAERALAWMDQILEALDYLHSRTPPVIHRDLKPANIKITPAGEAVLVDFGIAKAAVEGQATATGAVGLTPGYAPPEQYGLGHTDARTDVYALGATLYNLLTGQVPPDSVERLIGQAALQAPQAVRPEVPGHIDAAVQKALEVKTEDRFQSVAELRAALRDPAFSYHPPAAPVTPAAETTAPAPALIAPAVVAPLPRRRRGLRLAVFSLLALAGLAAGAYYLSTLPEIWARALVAYLSTPLVTVPPPVTQAAAVTLNPTAGPGLTPSPGPATAAPSATPTPTLPPSPTPQPEPISAASARGWRVFSSWKKGDTSVPLAFSPLADRVALPNEQGVDVFDLLTGETLQRLQGIVVGQKVIGLGFLPDALMVQFSDEILLVDTASQNLRDRLNIAGRDLTLSPDGRFFAVRAEYISVFNFETRQLLWNLGSEGARQNFAFSPDGRWFALESGSDVQLWNLQTRQRETTLAGHGEPAGGLAFTPDSTRLVSAGGDVWELASRQRSGYFDSSTAHITLSPDGSLIVGDDGSVWELATGHLLATLPVSPNAASRLRFTPDGKFLVWQILGGEIQMWAADPFAVQATPAAVPARPPSEAISLLNLSRLVPAGQVDARGYRGLAFSPAGQIVAAWEGAEVDVIQPASLHRIATLGGGGQISGADFLGQAFVVGLTPGGVLRWEIGTGKLRQTYPVTGRRLVASPAGGLFAVQDKYIQVVDMITGRQLYNLGSADSDQDFAFTPDGKFLVIATGSGVGFVDLATGRQSRQLAGHGPRARGLAFTPDGLRLASAGGDVWDVASGKLLASFESAAERVAISPDGQLIVGDEGSLWDAGTGQYLGRLDFRAERWFFTPDSQYLVGLASDRSLTAYAIRPVMPHAAPSATGAPARGLRAVSPQNAAQLSLLGWWGDDPLLEVRLLRDNPQAGAQAFGPGQTIAALALGPDGHTLNTFDSTGLTLFDPATGRLVDQFRIFLNSDDVREAAYLGEHLLLLKEKAGVERWDLASQLLVQRYNVTGRGLVTSAGGEWFALLSGDAVQVVEAVTGTPLKPIRFRSPGDVQPFAFSPDGQTLAVANGLFAELWDLETQSRALALRGHTSQVFGLAFTPDGSRLLAASGDVWDLAQGALVYEMDSTARRLAVSPDGRLAAGDDGSVWDLTSGQRAATLLGMRAPAERLFFTGDGTQILMRTADGRLYAWGVPAEPAPGAPTPGPDAFSAANALQLKYRRHIGRGRLLAAHWSPDETYLAANTTQNAQVFRAETLELVYAELGASALAFDSDDNVLLGGGQPLRLVDPVTGSVVRTFGQVGVTAAAFSPNGRLLAIGGQVAADGRADGLAVIELSDGLVRVLDRGAGRYSQVLDLAFTADSSRLAASFPGAISLWNMDTNARVRAPITGSTGPARLSPDGRYIAYFSSRFVVETLDQGGQYRTITAAGTEFFPGGINQPNYAPIDYTFTPGGRLLVVYQKINQRTNARGVTVVEWDIDTGSAEITVRDLFSLSGIRGLYLDDYALAAARDPGRRTPRFGLGPAGTRLYSLTGDGVVRVWQYPGGESAAEGEADNLPLMALDPAGKTVAVPDSLGRINLVEVDTGRRAGALEGDWYPVHMAYLSHSLLAVAQASGTLSVIDVTTGQVVEQYQGGSFEGSRLAAVSPDGRTFALWERSSGGQNLSVYSFGLDGPLLALGRFPRADHLAFSPDGRLLAVVRGRSVEVWDLHTHRIVAGPQAQGRSVGPLVFTPDSARLVAATGEIWSTADGSLLATFDTTTDGVILSPNGQVIVGRDGTLWDSATGRPIDALAGLRGPALHYAFTADGRTVVWQNAEGVVEVWSLP